MARQTGRDGSRPKEKGAAVESAVPMTVVGAGLTAALMVLLLLTKSQLSQMGFAISALEREREELERQHDRLLIAYAEAYSLERVEQYATEKLGMVHPTADQYRFTDIETAEYSPKERSDEG